MNCSPTGFASDLHSSLMPSCWRVKIRQSALDGRLLTVEHILINCMDFQPTRQKYYTSANLSDLFNNVPSRTIVDFIKEIGLYRKLWILNGVFTTPPPSVLLLYVIRMYPFLHLYYFYFTYKRGPYNPKIVSFTIIHFSHLSVFIRVSLILLHKTAPIKF